MRIRFISVVVLVVVGLAAAAPAGATTSAQNKYINALHHAAPATKTVSNKRLLGLGSSICSSLKFASVADAVGILNEHSNTFHFPKSQVTTIVATTVAHLCPSHTNAVVAFEKKQSHPAPAKLAAPTTTTTTTAPRPTTTTAPPGPVLTQQQRSAKAEAQQYLATSPFSYQGLIDQLDSSAGSGYSVNDATVAVNNLTVDYNAEALQAAKQYLQVSPMSCQDLIDQLDSTAGDQYTVAQATYGAQQAGDC
jgi:hypothetical protein